MIRTVVLTVLAALSPGLAAAQPAETQEASGEAAMLDAVMAAIRADDAATLQRLLDADPSLAAQRDASRMSPLSLAVYMGKPHLAEIVRARRGSPDVFEAAILGDAETVRAALAAGQDIDAFAPDGFTLLALAVFFGHPDLAKTLIEAGADPNLQADNAQKVGPIHAAVARGDLASLEALLLAGGDANLPQQQGVTPLHSAGHTGNTAAVELLMRYGADIAVRDEQGRSAADHARAMSHIELAERLTPA